MRDYRPILVAALLLVAGCKTTTKVEPDATAAVMAGHAGVAAHIQSAERSIIFAAHHSSDVGRAYLGVATAEHEAALAKLRDAEQALKTASAQALEASQKLQDAIKENERLRSKPLVRAALWIERVLWIVGISWLVLGVLAIVTGMGNPLGWLRGLPQLSVELVRLLPLANVFSWIRNWFRRRRNLPPL